MEAGRRRLRHQAVRAARPGRARERAPLPIAKAVPVIRDSLATALRAALVDVGIEPPPRSTSSGRAGVSTATGRRTWPWPRPRRPAATRASWPASSSTRLDGRAAAARGAGRDRRPGLRQLPPRATPGCTTCSPTSSPAASEGYARPDLGGGTQVNVEFVSANPTGPLHAGHGRWRGLRRLAVPGSSSARGHDVHREYYLNDRGAQMQLFARVAGRPQARARTLPEDGYAGRLHHASGRPRCPTTPTRSSGATSRCKRDQRETLGAHRRRASTPGSASSSLGRVRRHRRDARRPARPRRGLRRRRRRVAALHRLRRRQGPGPRQVRRRAHLPAPRHRLPPRQVRPRASSC